jgi:hypothetical protein
VRGCVFACGIYLIAEEEEEEEERIKRKYSIHKVFRAREKEGEFYTLFGRLRDDRQKFFLNILE